MVLKFTLQLHVTRFCLNDTFETFLSLVALNSCSERGREGRLTVLLDETRRQFHISRGFGVDENTALVVTHAESDAITGKVRITMSSVFKIQFYLYFHAKQSKCLLIQSLN